MFLAIDQGTTSSRAIVFDRRGRIVSSAQQEFPQHYPQNGWVEHDPEDIWNSTLRVSRAALEEAEAKCPAVKAIGITNQRETTLLWERATGRPLHNAIVWQDRRTADYCAELKRQGHEESVSAATGLLLDPYFSASKLHWLLETIPGARHRAEKGELAFGTVDSYLLWRLTGGKVHATDITNASRTLLYNIHKRRWDQQLLTLFDIPAVLLPEVKDCAADFGTTDPAIFGCRLPILGIAGDQQAAAIGQACFAPGMTKSTYGTGCFVLMNTGDSPIRSGNRLLTTIAWRIAGRTSYAVEGSIFIAGAAVQWIRDNLKLITNAAETEQLAAGLGSNHGVYLVPAFTGLGAPHWDPQARGALFGLTRDTGIAEIARATLESVVYQTRDLMTAMAADGAVPPTALRIDGGMVANNWFCQFLADLLDLTVERPEVTETTALGAACLAGLQAGSYASLDEIAAQWQCQSDFKPQMTSGLRRELIAGWDEAISKVRTE
ncbi:glycerol kinase [Geothermobacter hydrogeniphilus]|uniref:Glycerol kinase n=1 Tax=Geothermobacter hydrogeniphilus TaxID=1969733 RepID=A0A2K2HB83_9BACT|nr:glycerol kinase GlpK [Geothermobacter hydrogeniphilus]PNU20562.1 glycerol kinase [Geothermobacter hydrogeniphilus]